MANFQDLDIYAGETRTLTLYARTPENGVQDLTDREIAWFVSYPLWTPDQMSPVLQKTGTVTDATAGKFTVTLYPPDTVPLEGNYVHLALAIIPDIDGAIQFVSDTDDDINFTNDSGDVITFVSDLNGTSDTLAVTSGTLHIRRSVLQF